MVGRQANPCAYTGKTRSLTGKKVAGRCVGGAALDLLRVALDLVDQRNVWTGVAPGVAEKATPLAIKEMRVMLDSIMETIWRL